MPPLSQFLQGVLGAAGNFTSIVGVIGIFSSFIAYLSGRRQHLFAPSQRDSYDAAMFEIRQSLAALTATVAALGAPMASTSNAPPVSTPAQSPVMPGAPPFFPVTPPLASPSATSSLPKIKRVHRPGLAIFAGVGILFTLAVIGGVTTPFDSAINSAFFVFYLLGIVLTLVTLVWACVLAVRIKRWGWLVALILGTVALYFLTIATAPGVLILIFAIWGPTEPPKGKMSTISPPAA